MASATMTSGSASRPAPESPPASARSRAGRWMPRRSRVARFSCTDGCSHISVCMAGQTSTGGPGASKVAVRDRRTARRRSGRTCGPWRHDHHQVRLLAEAVWGIGEPRPTETLRGSEASAENVTAPTKRVASSVSTGSTWTPASTSRRQTSTALYAAMPPETPRTAPVVTRTSGQRSTGLPRSRAISAAHRAQSVERLARSQVVAPDVEHLDQLGRLGSARRRMRRHRAVPPRRRRRWQPPGPPPPRGRDGCRSPCRRQSPRTRWTRACPRRMRPGAGPPCPGPRRGCCSTS